MMKLSDWMRSHMYVIFDPTSESRISGLEHTLGITLPNDYRDFLIDINGGGMKDYLFFDVPDLGRDFFIHVFYGIDTPYKECDLGGLNLLLTNDNLDPMRRNEWLPIAATPEGNYLCINSAVSSSQYGVVKIKTPDSLGFVASGFTEFCKSLGWI